MKKVMVYAYTKFNLGDDLFLKILFERYPNTNFVLFTQKKYRAIFKHNNVKILSSDNLILRGFNYISRRINKNYTINKIISKSCDASVYIGGSIFQQRDNWKVQINNRKNLLNENQPFYVLGANFGPFNNENYYLEYKKLISKYEDICFRDTYSYKLFKDLNNVRMGDDIVFSLNKNKTYRNDKNIVISVIKPSYRPYLSEYDDLYYKKIKDTSIEFIKKGYKITLMSFCKHEGDEEAIGEILKTIPQKYSHYIEPYNYRGNIEQSLDVISSSSLVIGTRFHAMILGWLFNKPVVPIVYSEKMTNVMKDVGFSGLYTDFNSIDQLDPVDIVKSMETNFVDITVQIENSEKHFKELDKLLLDMSLESV
ncbi:polysaccharide pyruvyl transferase family protein [Oceanobacillus sp. FSL W7-1304]|uniref:polysaccharide pyruvyl transferase family protein n=1 Tax=Oceanobacillus sp. FSL W7-1304 TaxID=2975322 RepID=UPI0030DBBD91